jgi:hypothetical protein
MVASNGTPGWFRACVVVCAGWLASAPAAAQAQDAPVDEVQRLRAHLAQPGVDGREAREGAIEQLLTMPRADAHAVLLEALARGEDPDQVRLAIVTSLQRHLLLAPAAQFGGASGRVRDQLVVDYLRVLAKSWRALRGQAGEPDADPVLRGARASLQRLPPREVDAAARTLLTSVESDDQIDVMRCLADLQQTLFASTIAERLEAADEAVRIGARNALRLLICSEHEITSKAQFAAWHAQHGSLRYVDLVERAARRGAAPQQKVNAELARVRVDAAREIVRAHVNRSPGIDWAAVSARVIVDDTEVLDACLELLQTALPTLAEDASVARAAFCRELLARYRREPTAVAPRRARLLEVAAYLGRPDDAELAGELTKELLAQLASAEVPAQLAALRGLRRFPLPETRARLVAYAKGLLADPAATERIVAALTTLSTRGTPRWHAPSPGDPDRSDWLALVAAVCRSEAGDLRDLGLALAQTPDQRDQRVAEMFHLLVELVRDPALPAKYRALCVTQVHAWRNDTDFADPWLRLLHDLLRDAAPELRQRAAESLAAVAEAVDSRRTDRIGTTLGVLRESLAAETEPAVFRALVETVQVCGREPLLSERAIGVLKHALAAATDPVPTEQAFRVEPLLQALTAIGADPRADRGQWLAAGEPLYEHRRRQSLRLILTSHGAADLIKDVGGEPGLAERARRAVRLIVLAALLKPSREAWNSTEELRNEARDVRAAFGALDTVDEKARLDAPDHRMLRLEVELVAGKPQDVVQRATAWLANGSAAAWTDEQSDRIRAIAAEAQLLLGRPDAARKLLDERGSDAADDAAVRELECKVARALVATDLAGAVELLQRVWRRTSTDDPAFRTRLVEWMQLRIRLDPALRDETLRTGEQHAELFRAPDCPTDVREAWTSVRGSRS